MRILIRLFPLALLLLISFMVSGGTVRAQDVQDFTFSSFEADYYLSRDEDGRSRLRVVERLTAEFPDFDQNKGIVRVIPVTYEGRPLSFRLESLERNGQVEPVYDKSYRNNNVEISTGSDDYVRGTQVYEITYTMRDVTRDFDEYQEFFWDTNGTQWRQPFEKLEARVYMEGEVKNLFTGEAVCFEGPQGSAAECPFRIENGLIAFSSNGSLEPGENVTMLMKFEPGAFEPYQEGFMGKVMTGLALLSAGLAAAALVMAALFKKKNSDKSGRRGVIVPEYLQPEGISVLMAAGILSKQKFLTKSVAAQSIDLAVKGKIKVIESEKKGLFSKNKQYEIEFIDDRGVLEDESRLLDVFFGANRQAGARFAFKPNDTATGQKVRELHGRLKKKVLDKGYRRRAKGVAAPFVLLVAAFLLSLVVTSYLDGTEDWRSALVFLIFWLVFPVIALATSASKPLRDKGRETLDYLEGLKMYIGLAEAERLRTLQSPKGALKTSINTGDKEQIVKLYEQLLPYAVLFGQEKEWLKQLSVYYEQQQTAPGWYVGTAGFNAGSFASSVSSFSASTSSSSSGFSGGGGSGGGGGGGGGGGR